VSRAQAPRDKAHARLELAKVLEEQVGDAARAQGVVEEALAQDPSDEDVLAELERLASATRGWRQASDALAMSLAAARDIPKTTLGELWVRLARWRRDRLEDGRAAEDAYGEALKLDPESLDVLKALEELRRGPGRERDLVQTLRARAKLETDLDDKKTILREAKELAQGTVADAALAEATLRDVLAEDEADAWALEELGRLREAAGDWAEVVTLLLKRAEIATDGGDAAAGITLKQRAATVRIEKLEDTTGAIALYEEILEAEPSLGDAATTLRGLYAKAGMDRDLAKLLERLVDVASSPGERSALRIDLAQLQAAKFHAPEDAIDTLRAVLDEEPMHGDAVMRLSSLFEETGKDAELADLLKAQLEAAKERGDIPAELAMLVRLGQVQESRLGDAGAALESYERVLEREPSHRGALEAIARLSEKRSAWDRASAALLKLLELPSDGETALAVSYALRLADAREKLEDAVGMEDALKRALARDQGNQEVRGRLRALYEKDKKWAELAEMLMGDVDLVQAAHPEAREAAPAPAAAVKQSVPPPGGSVGRMSSVAPGAMTVPPPAVPAALADVIKTLRRVADIHLKERSNPGDAIPVLEKASALVPYDRELLLALCDAYTAAERGRDAATALEKIIASFGNKRTKELSLYHHRLGRALAKLGEKDVALAQLDMAFKIDPGSVTVLRDLGMLAFESNDLDRAQKTFRALLLQRLDPATGISKGEVFYYLGEISAKQGDKQKAVQMFERAIENEPTLAKAKTKLSELKG
jgi:tetratricopeptide (TPR) repeat protein